MMVKSPVPKLNRGELAERESLVVKEMQLPTWQLGPEAHAGLPDWLKLMLFPLLSSMVPSNGHHATNPSLLETSERSEPTSYRPDGSLPMICLKEGQG